MQNSAPRGSDFHTGKVCTKPVFFFSQRNALFSFVVSANGNLQNGGQQQKKDSQLVRSPKHHYPFQLCSFYFRVTIPHNNGRETDSKKKISGKGKGKLFNVSLVIEGEKAHGVPRQDTGVRKKYIKNVHHVAQERSCR